MNNNAGNLLPSTDLRKQNITFFSSATFIVGEILRHTNEKSIGDPSHGFVFFMH